MRYDFPRLTGLRFILALWVICYHMLPLTLGLLDPPVYAYAFFARGWLAVDAFFILSGFIITHHYGHRLRDFNVSQYGHFLWNRLARLYPLHLLTLLLLLALVATAHLRDQPVSDENYSVSLLIQNLFLVQAWHIPDRLDWNHPAWAISIEWLLYLLCPLLFKILLRPMPSYVLMLLWIVSLTAFPLALMILPYETHIAYAVIRGAGGFIAGIGLYQWLRAAPRVVPGTQWLASRVMQHAGDASYAVYMMHYPVLLIAAHPRIRDSLMAMTVPQKIIYLAGVMIVILLTGWLAHGLIEQPVRQFMRQRNPFRR